METVKTTFGNVVLGARVIFDGKLGQKIDEPAVSGNKYKNRHNFLAHNGSANLSDEEAVETTRYSLKDKPEWRHL